MGKIFGLLAVPLGYVLQWIYRAVPSYFIAIFLFTLVVRILMFPLNIKTQKSSADRARLAPRLERIQKKYANDRQKLQQKQQELYEKEGVSLTGGCLPMLIQMLVLFSVIAVIYKPLTYVERMPESDINTCITAVVENNPDIEKKIVTQMQSTGSYYREMYLMRYTDSYGEQMEAALVQAGKTPQDAAATVETLKNTKKDFSVFGVSLLEQPSYTGIRPNWLWVIAILSGVSALLSSLLSMHYSKGTMPTEQQGGCSPNLMMYMMPLFSLVISFGVPAGVAVYWIFSNLLALVQTAILNHMYNPAKIRAQAEIEYAERRRKKAEDKERLRQARLAEQAAWQQEENEKRAAKEGKRPPVKQEKTPAGSEETGSERE